MMNLSKTTFRSRNIEADRPIPIFHVDELADLNDYTSVSRTITQMPTGMEKEEETEHHLRVAMQAQSLHGETRHLAIPVPEVTLLDHITYPTRRRFIPPKNYIKQALEFQENQQKYDMDSDDDAWLLEKQPKLEKTLERLEFEQLIDRLEWLHKFQPHELRTTSIETLLCQPPNISHLVHKFWQSKRQNIKTYASLIPEVRTEQAEGSSVHDPYVAFRKRFEKMQTRKNRKNDEALFEKLVHTHATLIKSRILTKMTRMREELKLKSQKSLLKLFNIRFNHRDIRNAAFYGCLETYYKSHLAPAGTPKIPNYFLGFGVVEHENMILWQSSWRHHYGSFRAIKKIVISSIIQKPKKPVPLKEEPKPNTIFFSFLQPDENGFSSFPLSSSTQNKVCKAKSNLDDVLLCQRISQHMRALPEASFMRMRRSRAGYIVLDHVRQLQPVDFYLNCRDMELPNEASSPSASCCIDIELDDDYPSHLQAGLPPLPPPPLTTIEQAPESLFPPDSAAPTSLNNNCLDLALPNSHSNETCNPTEDVFAFKSNSLSSSAPPSVHTHEKINGTLEVDFNGFKNSWPRNGSTTQVFFNM